MVYRGLLVVILVILAIGHCHSQEELRREGLPKNETTVSFGERLQPSPTSTTIQEVQTELNRTSDRAQVNQTQVDSKRAAAGEPLEGHSSDLLASILGEPGELEISGLHLSATPQTSSDQRRFDDATLAMASTGQARGNRFLMPSETQFGANSRLMLKQQQLMAALDPLGAGDPYFMDTINPKRAPQKREQSQASRRSGFKRQRQEEVKSLNPQRPRTRPESADDIEEDPDYRRGAKFADGDDIFKDDNELVPRQKSASMQRAGVQTDESSADEAEGDEEDDESEAGSETTGRQVQASEKRSLARSGPTVSSDKVNSNKRQSPRRPLKGIEDSAPAEDERLDASNVKASKRRPEVELVLRSYQNNNNKGRKQVELEAEEVTSANSQQLVEKSGAGDLQAAAGHHHGHHGHHHYYQYAGVPKKKAWKMGFKRGNHKHEISRHEKGYKNKFHSSFKWHAKEKCKKKKKCHSVGKMSWHYEHHDKKKKHHHY